MCYILLLPPFPRCLHIAILLYCQRIKGIPGVMSWVTCRVALSWRQSSYSCHFRQLKSYFVPIYVQTIYFTSYQPSSWSYYLLIHTPSQLRTNLWRAQRVLLSIFPLSTQTFFSVFFRSNQHPKPHTVFPPISAGPQINVSHL